MIINSQSVKNAIDKYFHENELELFENSFGISIYNLINSKMLMLGLITFDLPAFEKYMCPCVYESLSNNILKNFGVEIHNLVKKAIKMRCYIN